MLDLLAVHGGEQVAHHAGVDAAVLGFGGLAQPRRDEDIGWFHPLQRGLHRVVIHEIDRDVFHALGQVVFVAGNASDLPTLRGLEMFSQMAADNSGYTGDQSVADHQFSPFVESVTLMQACGSWPSSKAFLASSKLKW